MTLIQFVIGKVFDSKVAIVQARLGVERDVAVQLVTAAAQENHENTSKLAIYASSKILTVMLVGFAVPFILYTWKIVVVDIVIGRGCIGFHPFGWEIIANHCWVGTTDPIKGQVAEWATTIIGFLFGSATTVTIGKMWFNRDKAG